MHRLSIEYHKSTQYNRRYYLKGLDESETKYQVLLVIHIFKIQ